MDGPLRECPENEYQLIEYSYTDAADIRVPGDFNTQVDELFYYRDTVWYQRHFDIDLQKEVRYHLWFGGANYKTTIYLTVKPLHISRVDTSRFQSMSRNNCCQRTMT